jgi:tetratricopeptide (TPR) repeat protein
MTFRSHIAVVVALAAAANVAPAAPGGPSPLDALHRAVQAYNDGQYVRAAVELHRIEEIVPGEEDRFEAQFYLGEALNRLGLGFSAFFQYAQMVRAGPAHPHFLRAVEGAANLAETWNDEVVGPNVLDKAYGDLFGRLPPEVLPKINASLALLDYRAGRYREAEQFVGGVPESSPAYPQARYLAGLLAQRGDPERAVQIFRGLLDRIGTRRDLSGLAELIHLALGRTLYGLRRYREAAREYEALPRFSRHWDEALFEGAYAYLQADAPGEALGKLHGLHSPHLSDEFAPESENLAAIVYLQNCLYPQARAALQSFETGYLPMRERVKALLAQNPPLESLVLLLQPGATALPTPVQHHLRKNERISSMLAYLERLGEEEARLARNPELARSALGSELLEQIGKQRLLVGQVAGKFINGRLADLAHLIDVLDGEKETIAFETAKGEKELLESKVDVRARLAAQTVERPAMPSTGHEYWPFDGEYWPDEIGRYKYTLKSACPALRKEE